MFILQDLQKRVEGYCTDMRRYQLAQDECTAWLDAKRQILVENKQLDGSRDALESRLSAIRVRVNIT